MRIDPAEDRRADGDVGERVVVEVGEVEAGSWPACRPPSRAGGRSPRPCSGRRRTRSSRRSRARGARRRSPGPRVAAPRRTSGAPAARAVREAMQRRRPTAGGRPEPRATTRTRWPVDGELDRTGQDVLAGASHRRARGPPAAPSTNVPAVGRMGAVAGPRSGSPTSGAPTRTAPPSTIGRASPSNAARSAAVVLFGDAVLAAIAATVAVERRSGPRGADRLDRAERDPLGRERPGLVGAERVDPADRLDRALPLGQRAEARDPERRGGVGHGQHQRQALGHERRRARRRRRPSRAWRRRHGRQRQNDDRRGQRDEDGDRDERPGDVRLERRPDVAMALRLRRGSGWRTCPRRPPRPRSGRRRSGRRSRTGLRRRRPCRRPAIRRSGPTRRATRASGRRSGRRAWISSPRVGDDDVAEHDLGRRDLALGAVADDGRRRLAEQRDPVELALRARALDDADRRCCRRPARRSSAPRSRRRS